MINNVLHLKQRCILIQSVLWLTNQLNALIIIPYILKKKIIQDIRFEYDRSLKASF